SARRAGDEGRARDARAGDHRRRDADGRGSRRQIARPRRSRTNDGRVFRNAAPRAAGRAIGSPLVSQSAVAERYARAILELADESGQLSSVYSQVRAAADAYGASPELRAILSNPAVNETSRDALLKEIGSRLGLSVLALNSMRLMAQKGRLSALPDVANMLGQLADQKAGVLRATVTSARPLSEESYQKLAAELEKRTSR